MLRVAINGYGRIGRNVHRQFCEMYGNDVEVVAVNASSDAEMRAYLLKYDSLHGHFKGHVEVKGDHMMVNGKDVRVVKERDPAKCPWKELNVDIVVESTGNFDTHEEVEHHLKAGAKRVIVTAPMKDKTPTFVMGVNDHTLTKDMHIISNASCTTNCIAPIIKVMDEAFIVESLLVSSVHAFTATQNLLDNKSKEGGELRRARAATLSMIPTKTGAVKACGDIFPHLKGKMDGMAFRVPVPTVSCAYMAFRFQKEVSIETIHAKLEAAAERKEMKGVLSISHDQCVSIDFQTDPHSSIVDAPSTKVVDGTAAQILSWYDNEWGYAMRVTEMALRLAALI
ncbi:MAG: type I glyceraldehyde-3-phosphate dehydrogenase [Candidatus Peribacteraceae bacterium]|nr:type I glyceraldehyde-3-phosphate dehydrogenase [Candidatus Peribacteraceae bacterium]MBP9850531.1 type I glyceraldehyde-3-phosphate dehydrogenase [Candidatus Peribacteraceae bacterium]